MSGSRAAGGKPPRLAQRPSFERIALILQGGGALGSYQAGAYQALAEAGLEPDWVAGISIGAVNSALIAGNPPQKRVDRLRQFWEAVSTSPTGLNLQRLRVLPSHDGRALAGRLRRCGSQPAPPGDPAAPRQPGRRSHFRLQST
jgi:predicted acylesterase/phospholipase RssA